MKKMIWKHPIIYCPKIKRQTRNIDCFSCAFGNNCQEYNFAKKIKTVEIEE